MNAWRLLTVGLVVALGAPVPALAADGPIRDPDHPRSSRIAQLGFTLPAGWEIARGMMEGTPSRGGYVRDISLGEGAACEMSIRAGGAYRARTRAPRVVRGKLRDGSSPLFAVKATGKLPGGRWYRGRLGEAASGSQGVAKLSGAVVLTPAPSLRSPGRPIVLGKFTVIPRVKSPRAATRDQRRRCRDIARPRMVALLAQVLRSVRVEAYAVEPDGS